GKVIEVLCDKTQVNVRVQYLDKQGLISKPLPVKQFGSRSTQAFWCPKVGDDVHVTVLPNGHEEGFVDGSFYNNGNPPPITDPNTRHITFADGTIMEYSEGNSTLTINSKGPINITTTGAVTLTANGTVSIKGSSITLDGPTTVKGKLTVQGDISNTGNMTTSGVHTDSIGRHDA